MQHSESGPARCCNGSMRLVGASALAAGDAGRAATAGVSNIVIATSSRLVSSPDTKEAVRVVHACKANVHTGMLGARVQANPPVRLCLPCSDPDRVCTVLWCQSPLTLSAPWHPGWHRTRPSGWLHKAPGTE